MRDIRLIIQKPVITEKSAMLQETKNRFVFRVDTTANKRQIKAAIEQLFSVTVKDVRTAVVRGKEATVMNRAGRFSGYKPNWKKAYVTLAEGDTIDIVDTV